MNCKPGDLAVVVRCIYKENIGALFRVIGNYRCDPDEWYGEILSTVKTNFGIAYPGEKIWMDDKDLCPIRDPGENAKDETLSWLPVPFPTLETA